MLDKYLIEHCSPTLASLKTANLFSFSYDCERGLEEHVIFWDTLFQPKGVSLEILRKQEGTALLYVYRRDRLQEDLLRPGVARFLGERGYDGPDAVQALEKLKDRLSEEAFPHEIGLFLGYPLGDVIGFIHNVGKNCKCSGCWKVYGDEREALKLFAKYKKCRTVYSRLWRQGKSVLQLTVAA